MNHTIATISSSGMTAGVAVPCFVGSTGVAFPMNPVCSENGLGLLLGLLRLTLRKRRLFL
ncbi:hypothetical protein [Turicimonas muris]|uniref:Uncharacterized protein n=1 Tax=Turicimonas muris TaxID=1796652 RepID=A0A227KR47_9BURK|nr:hypothetical protein [Turicimonas muris]OXE49843.1 hypothetical protein ADH67_06880 [Turicimonas muris]